MKNRRLLASALVALAAALPLSSVQAQSWPTRPVRIVVPFAAGGPADAMARFLANKMAADIGQTIVIDNKGGAGGTLGSAEVIRSSDGHSLLFSSTGALVIVPALTPNLGYNPERDLVAIGQAVITPSVIVVSAKSPFNTVADLVKFAKANPGKLNFASAGSGTSTQLGAELLKKEAGIFMTHIPYRGAAPATTDLIGGVADLMVADVPAVVAFIKGGQLRALAVASPTRSPALPEIPTTAEANLKGVVSGTWYGLMAPSKTPPEVIAKVNAALNKALQHPDTVAFFKLQGVQSVGGSPEEFGQFIRAEAAKWGALAKAVGVKLD
jgi:tripartite-type tricarboxylate transporter receptor subunit TctC